MLYLTTDDGKPSTAPDPANFAELVYNLPDGTVIKIYPPKPLTVEAGHRESLRWGEALETLFSDGKFGKCKFAPAGSEAAK